MKMKEILEKLIRYESLTRDEAYKILLQVAQGDYNQSQIASFLTIFMMRSITLEELDGFRAALLELCLSVDLSDFDPIDLCGTGGDGKDTFNISTLASFVVAGAGIPVAKHGNYGVSSNCGSSNVMEYLGISFLTEEDHLKQCLDNARICILHAPLFHPAMKQVAPIRRELGIKTFFNMLGPLVNPSHLKKQVVGVFDLELARLYGYLYQNTNVTFTILHSLDGYDELSLTDDAKIISRQQERIIGAEDLGFSKLEAWQLKGGQSVEESAKIFLNILQNKGTNAQKEVVLANAGLAISTATSKDWITSVEIARESLESGKAYNSFKKLHSLST